jgi:hypothetical protein
MAKLTQVRASDPERRASDADPLSFSPRLHAKFEEAYDAQLHAFLSQNLLVGFEPVVPLPPLAARRGQRGRQSVKPH